MISKELLSEVLKENVLSVRPYIEDDLFYKNVIIYECRKDTYDTINIYELTHKCKEWALSNKYMIDSNLSNTFQEVNNGIVGTSLIYNIDSMASKRFQSDTEQGAVFKACEYIMENKCGS